MEKGKIYPTRNLDIVSPECQGIYHVREPLNWKINVLVKNCFAFGGINAALVCKKMD